MRRILILVGAIATLAAGAAAAVALGAGMTAPDTSTDTTTAVAGATTTTAPDTATGTTTTTAAGATTTAAGATATTAPDTSTGTTTAVAAGATTTTAPSKVWVCHHTGSWKHPYHLIHISTHALPAHMSHGDVTPGADNSCPTTQPAGTKTHGRGNGQSNNAKTKDDNPAKGDDEIETNDD
jgi:hypothetical protein